MPDHLGDDMRKVKDETKEEPEIKGMCRIPYKSACHRIVHMMDCV